MGRPISYKAGASPESGSYRLTAVFRVEGRMTPLSSAICVSRLAGKVWTGFRGRGQEPVAVEGHGDSVRQEQRPQVVAHLDVLVLGHAHTPLEYRPTLTLVRLFDAALLRVEDDGAFGGADGRPLTDGKD